MRNRLRIAPSAISWPFLAALFLLAVTPSGVAQSALVQVIHASPFVEADTVDVYLADTLAIDNFSFTSATPMLELPGGEGIDVAITGGDAAGPEEAVWQGTFTPSADSVYWWIAAGDPLGRDGYAAFDLIAFGEPQSVKPGPNDVFLTEVHAIPDLEKISIKANGNQYVTDQLFGEHGPWIFMDQTDAGVETIITLQNADDISLNAYAASFPAEQLGGSIIAVHSGFANPPTPEHPGLLYFNVYSKGQETSVKINEEAHAYVFFVNASPYPETEYVSLWVGNAMLADSVAFRSGPGTLSWFPGLESVEVRTPSGVAEPRTWRSETRRLTKDAVALLVVAGDPLQRPGQPRMLIYQQNETRGLNPPGETVGILVFNAVWDSPPLDYALSDTPETPFVSSLRYGAFSEEHVEIPHDSYTVLIQSGGILLAEIEADLSAAWPAEAALAIDTGFFDPPGDTLPGLGSQWIFSDGTAWEFPVAVDVEETDLSLPTAFSVHGNYPNPFNPTTRITFDLPHLAEVEVAVYDVSGRAVLRTSPRVFEAGRDRSIDLDASALSSGLYFYRVQARMTGETVLAGGRMVLVK